MKTTANFGNYSFSLKERTFSTFNFYKEHQDVLIPVGLSFFQSDWDESLSDFFHKTLCMYPIMT